MRLNTIQYTSTTSIPGPSRWDGDEDPGKIRFIVPKFWEKFIEDILLFLERLDGTDDWVDMKENAMLCYDYVTKQIENLVFFY